ncbi:DUF2809 domain-containing protein [Bacteroides sp. 224]|uniref:ribosomal maturation YjgA family protein n=1 Tax=Bacteroides sp. 224 TaxID=2302936 RepID=UPI00351BE43F
MNNRLFYALCFIALFAIEVLIALHVRDQIIRPYVGDILVVVLVYCFARIFISKPLRLLPLWVFLFACGVEVMQYFQIATLLNLQNNTVARIVIGSTFDWKDIMCYTVGCLPLFLIRK